MQPKSVSPVELFYDLVFVFAIVQVSALLHPLAGAGPTLMGGARAVVLFVPLYWAWAAMVTYTNVKGSDSPAERLAHFAAGLCALVMAVSVPEAFGDRGIVFGAAFLAQRVVVTLLQQLRRTPEDPSPTFMLLSQISGPIMLAGAFLPGNWRLGAWAVAVVADLVLPRVVGGRPAAAAFEPKHLRERYGLFLLLALGEAVLAIGATVVGLEHLTPSIVAALASGFALVCGLWWLYLHYAAGTERPARALRGDQLGGLVGFTHLFFVAGVLGVAVGLGEAVAHPGEPLPFGVAALLFGGFALYLITFVAGQWVFLRRIPWTRLAAFAVVVALFKITDRLSAGLSLLDLAVVAFWLNIIEYAWSRRRHRRSVPEMVDPAVSAVDVPAPRVSAETTGAFDFPEPGGRSGDPATSTGSRSYDPMTTTGSRSYDPMTTTGSRSYDPMTTTGSRTYDPMTTTGSHAYDPLDTTRKVEWPSDSITDSWLSEDTSPTGRSSSLPAAPPTMPPTASALREPTGAVPAQREKREKAEPPPRPKKESRFGRRKDTPPREEASSSPVVPPAPQAPAPPPPPPAAPAPAAPPTSGRQPDKAGRRAGPAPEQAEPPRETRADRRRRRDEAAADDASMRSWLGE
ncbi:low temperature requirement protein A [Hamadaea tsunoensis]|uniref:low temperature requirement protein A n=1 Tax=Hamadaea tsunoensis TaxID=53368 RepID=UPI00042393CD|nr:low temperature requirement protein A [Hamadaea tsunoensis]